MVNAKSDVKREGWLMADMNVSINKSMIAHAGAQKAYIFIFALIFCNIKEIENSSTFCVY